MKKNSNKQSNNVKNSLNNKNSKATNCNRTNNVKNSNNNDIGFEEDSKSFTLDENDDHSFELK